ncbi:MAG: hypothetical protein ACXAC5_11305 [Promethearchaeota archaeon]|jgi:hypothetical protein
MEIEETPVTIEISMETQEIKKEEKANYRTIHFALIAFVFFQVLFYFTFSEPLTLLFEGHYLFPIIDDSISRTARFVMIYHSLAVPFLVANTFWIMEYYEIRSKYIPTLKILLLSGAFMVGIAGMLFGFTYIRLFHEIFYFGLFLVFLGGIIFVIAAFPIPGKFPNEENSIRGSHANRLSLEHMNLVILAICVMVSTIMGAIAALENFTGTIWGLDREPAAFLAEAIIRHHHHDVVEDFVVSHLHIQLAQSAAMVLMVGYRTSRISGKPYKGVLLANAIGVIVISYGSWVLNHYVIWVGAGILILCTITMGGFGWKNIARDSLGERYTSSPLVKKLKGMIKDPIKFTYYFLFVMSHLFVTITGIIVGLQVDEFYRIPGTLELEYDFNVGHWHVLSVLIANILVLKAIDYYNVKGLQRKIGGWVFFIGSVLAFGGADIYMLRPLPAENIQPGYTIMIIGVWFLFVAFVWAVIAISRQLLKDRKEKKLLLLGDQYEKTISKEI